MAVQASFELFLVSLVVTIIGIAIRRRYFHPLSKFPGPFWGSVTSLSHVYYYILGTQSQVHRALHQKYGPVVRYGPSHLIISDHIMLPEIYHRKADKTNFYDSPLNEGSETVFSEKHHVPHIAARRVLAHAYSLANVKDMEPQIQEVIDMWVKRLDTHEEKPFVLWDRALWLAYDVLGIMAFGKPFGFVEEWTDVRAMLKRAAQSTTSGKFLEIINRIPALSWLAKKTRVGRRLLLPWPSDKIGLGVLKAERDTAWAEYFERSSPNSASCLLSQMLDKRTKVGQDASFNDDRIKAELLIAMLAGTTTTATILSSIVLNVAAREQYCTQLSSETTAAYQRDRKVNYEISRRLTYLAACVQEGYRFSAAPTQFPRLVDSSKSIELNGIRLPPGTVVSSSIYVIARNEALFGNRLDDFLPERWINASEEIKSQRKKYDFRFGYGARTCLGKHLVEMEIHNTVFDIFRRGKIMVHDKEKGVISMRVHDTGCV